MSKKINQQKKKFDKDGSSYCISFYDSDDFISTLLGTVQEFRIIKPDWLRKKMLVKLNKIIKILWCDIISHTFLL